MRPSDIRYLSFGLGIGALIASLFFIGFLFVPQPAAPSGSLIAGIKSTLIPATAFPTGTNTASPTATEAGTTAPTFTSTPTSLPTSTPLPSATATLSTAQVMIGTGEIVPTGPLTLEQQIKLYEASLFFIAPTYEQSKQMSVLINHVRFSDPSNTCGPLAIAILQKAGILSESALEAHDFFLINPDLGKDQITIKTAFPKELYTNTRYKVKINQFDWRANPLLPGDFVYIYSGTEGNFEHMLVVNRVDSQGRVYSVTNYNTEQGFIIDEVMLYDPSDPTLGMFAQWTAKPRAKLGSTGFAGFEVWRLIQ